MKEWTLMCGIVEMVFGKFAGGGDGSGRVSSGCSGDFSG